MHFGSRISPIVAVLLFGCSLSASGQAPATPTHQVPKLCVADIANSSLRPIDTNAVKAKLVEQLQYQNLNATDAATHTMLGTHLDLSGKNLLAYQREKCDFILLTRVGLPESVIKNAAAAGQNPSTIAQPTPLLVEFALFQKGIPKAVLESSLTTEAADKTKASDTLMAVMKDEATQVWTWVNKNALHKSKK
jgi:hypothetical protein